MMPAMKRNEMKSLMLSMMVVLLWAIPAAADEDRLLAAIDNASANCRAISQKIYDYRELGHQEFKSSKLLMAELARLGFKVNGNLKVPEHLVKGGVAKTAFRAEMAGNGPGPTITIMLEYDALPNGHSCGHNLISASGLLAAAGLAKLMKETPGRLVVIGTPDEERGSLGGGKIALLACGHFEGTDLVLITHPGDMWSADKDLLAMRSITFVFKGKAAHAAAAPHKGINALDGVIQTFNGINAMRQHLRQDVRIHGIIKKGGEAVNIVPALAEAEFSVRALDTVAMEDAYAKLIQCAKAAAAASGATLEYQASGTFLLAPVNVPEYQDLVRTNLKRVGVKEDMIGKGDPMGSSDLGNVGHMYPTINLMFPVAPRGVSLHSEAMLQRSSPETAWPATVQAAKGIALTAYQLLLDPAKVRAIQSKFRELKANERI